MHADLLAAAGVNTERIFVVDKKSGVATTARPGLQVALRHLRAGGVPKIGTTFIP